MATRSKTPARATKPAPIVYHEISQRGEHRIVMIEPGQPAIGGEWTALTNVAALQHYRATTEMFVGGQDVLPRGVFRCTSVPHVV